MKNYIENVQTLDASNKTESTGNTTNVLPLLNQQFKQKKARECETKHLN